MKQLLTSLLLLLTAMLAGAAETASSLLAKVSQKIIDAKTLTADFKILSSDGSVAYGDFAAEGDKYSLTAATVSTVCNGKYQWTVDDQVREVTVIEPTPEEIAQVNPFAIIRNYAKDYKLKLLGDAGGKKRVELVPKAPDGISRVIISIDTATMLPAAMEITGEDGNSIKIEISNIKPGVNIPQSRFVINMKDFPHYEFIDMR